MRKRAPRQPCMLEVSSVDVDVADVASETSNEEPPLISSHGSEIQVPRSGCWHSGSWSGYLTPEDESQQREIVHLLACPCYGRLGHAWTCTMVPVELRGCDSWSQPVNWGPGDPSKWVDFRPSRSRTLWIWTLEMVRSEHLRGPHLGPSGDPPRPGRRVLAVLPMCALRALWPTTHHIRDLAELRSPPDPSERGPEWVQNGS